MSYSVSLCVRCLAYQLDLSSSSMSTSLCSIAPLLVQTPSATVVWPIFKLLLFILENMQWPRTAEGSERRLFFLGFKANLRQVFGRNCLLALLPVASTWVAHCPCHICLRSTCTYSLTHVDCRDCDGVHYPTQWRSVELGTMEGQRSAEEPEDEDVSEEQPLTSSFPV